MTLQTTTDTVVKWTKENDMRLNARKTHEMTISFKKQKPKFDPILINNAQIESVTSANLVSVNLQSDLKWDINTQNILKKAEKRLFFLKRLKQAKASKDDLMKFYLGVIRPVCE